MASRGTLPEGSKKPPRKESRRPSGMAPLGKSVHEKVIYDQ
jgi:hypothetical protein